MSKKTDFSKSLWPFHQIAEKIYNLLRGLKCAENYFERLKDKLKIIYPKYKEEYVLKLYMTEKISKLIMFIFAGVILMFIYFITNNNDKSIHELSREGYWGTDTTQQIIAKTNSIENELNIDVSHQKISEDEVKEIMNNSIDKLSDWIIGENKSLDEISYDLNLVSQIPDTDIDVYWEIEENEVIKEDGSVILENLKKEGTIVKFKAALCYEECMVTTEFYGNFVLPDLSEEELFKLKLKKEISRINESTVSKESLILPKKIDKKLVEYTQGEKDYSKIIFIVMFIVCLPLIFFAQDEQLEKKKLKRQTQMLADYPEIVNKLVLYIGAGLTIQGAFEMIVNNYLQDKKRGKYRAAYEELVFMYREVQGGVSFKSSIENLSNRCNVLVYRKLSMLLLQNLRKGSSELVSMLKQEAIVAFDERKNLARRLGEEAGTKILLPMVIMLGIVMVILIVPAWMSFQI